MAPLPLQELTRRPEMQQAPCWQHDSCCYIQGTGPSAYCCDVASGSGCSASSERYTCSGCVTGGCAGTDIWTRIGTSFQYAGNAKGENIALDKDPLSGFCAWFDEGPWANDGKEHGHFTNIMSEPNGGHPTPSWNEMGAGVVEVPSCGGYHGGRYTQDFGLRSGVTPAKIPSAIHRPQSGASVTVGAIWHSTAAPRLMSVVLDGTCTALTLAAGSASVGAYDSTVSAGGQRRELLRERLRLYASRRPLLQRPGPVRHGHLRFGHLRGGSCSGCRGAWPRRCRARARCRGCWPRRRRARARCRGCRPRRCRARARAGAAGLDAAAPGPDAAAPGPDAGAAGLDAAAPGPDAAAPGLDAAAPGADAAAPGLDAALGAEDAQASSGADAEWYPVIESGCGCSAGRASAPLWSLLAVVLAWLRRRPEV